MNLASGYQKCEADSSRRLNPEAPVFVPSNFGTAQRSTVVKIPKVAEDYDSLRARLTEQLEQESHECLICCEKVRIAQKIWSCRSCYQVFHLSCLKKWAYKSIQDAKEQQPPDSGEPPKGWRCPGCQSVSESIPHEYRCFCGKLLNPNPRHFQCEKVCGKPVNCGLHTCEVVCHSGACPPCSKTLTLACFCGKTRREFRCDPGVESRAGFSCGEPCGRPFDCGAHSCERACHEGDCGPCPFSPGILARCPCGKTDVSGVERAACTDPVPLCQNSCNKTLKCGSPANPHRCSAKCHLGECPPCPETSQVRCRCGADSKSVPCSEAETYTAANPLLCERRCRKMRTCKQHKCGNQCCMDRDHICMQICGKRLSCGKHHCEQLCHNGKCPPCLQAGFEELHCECGATFIDPPVPCGAKPPPCSQPCSRRHDCRHPVTHNCHSEPDCPPCAFLTKKRCYGGHEIRSNIPCHIKDVSCGKPCGRRLPCGLHYCMRACHPGECQPEGEKCRFTCAKPREACEHPCSALCHGEQPCPESPCKAMVDVSCRCGRKNGRMQCAEVERLWRQTLAGRSMQPATGSAAAAATSVLASGAVLLVRQESSEKYRCLSCDGECSRLERNRQLAAALDVEDPGGDGGGRGPAVMYTDFLKAQTKAAPAFVMSTEKAFIELIQGVETGRASARSHPFLPMGRDQRRFLHEYASYFLLESQAYDSEPQRNVVVTAKKGRSQVPKVLLSSLIDGKTPARVVAPKFNVWGINKENVGSGSGGGQRQVSGSAGGVPVGNSQSIQSKYEATRRTQSPTFGATRKT